MEEQQEKTKSMKDGKTVYIRLAGEVENVFHEGTVINARKMWVQISDSDNLSPMIADENCIVQWALKKQPSKLKGRKLEPKYRDPETGKTWAGRGRLPKFLQGKDKEQYRI